MARHHSPRRQNGLLRLLGLADIYRLGAARMKVAARGTFDGARHIALQHSTDGLFFRIGNWNGREQGRRIWMLRIRKQLRARRELDYAAEIHHRHTMRHVFDDSQVMANKEQSQTEFFL